MIKPLLVPLSYTAFCLVFCNSCSTGNTTKVNKKGEDPSSNLSTLTRLLPPISTLSESDVNHLPTEQQELYAQLSPSGKALFLKLTSEERSEAVAMTHKMTPDEAVPFASRYDIYDLPQQEQLLYSKLSPVNQHFFLILNSENSEVALNWMNKIGPDNAVELAVQKSVSEMPLIDQKVYSKLDSAQQLLFLCLTPDAKDAATRSASDKDPQLAVDRASQIDAKKLPFDQREFYGQLSPDNQALFLILTPKGRNMAMQLAGPMSPDKAVEFAVRRVPTDTLKDDENEEFE